MTCQKWDKYPRKEETEIFHHERSPGLPKFAILFQFKFYQNLSEKVVAVAEAVAAMVAAVVLAVAVAVMASAWVAKEAVAAAKLLGRKPLGRGSEAPLWGGEGGGRGGRTLKNAKIAKAGLTKKYKNKEIFKKS